MQFISPLDYSLTDRLGCLTLCAFFLSLFMSTIMPFLTYMFWPRLGGAHYSDPKIVGLMVVCGILILASFGIKFWRKSLSNAVTKKLSSSWSAAAMTFGIVGLVLVISRVEDIQFVEMRFLWVLWALAIALYVVIQWLMFVRRHYTVVEKKHVVDIRDRYMPKKKRK